ncbi:mucin-3A-like [Mixophyes fleayi]|uniref:mucin-3A-like n=1 Tax=Mixophyes fleayi TaxID=3061075 RepID=UPI003F4DC433
MTLNWQLKSGSWFLSAMKPVSRSEKNPVMLSAEKPFKAINTSLEVQLKINKEYSESLNDTKTPEYKEFELEFKTEMSSVYSNVPGYKDVEILSIRKGSIVVDHKVIAEVEIKEDINVTEEYKTILEQVKIDLTAEKDNCTGKLCIADILELKQVEPPSINDLCETRIPEGFRRFYSPLLTSEGLTCVSFCEPKSSKYENCNGGKCEIQQHIGPKCFCPNTDQYIYTSPKCTGRISKLGVYGGIGTAICLLIIIIITGAFFLVRTMRKKSCEENELFDDKDEKYVKYGISSLYTQLEDGEENSSWRTWFSKGEFRPSLEKIDPSIKVKIKRPETVRQFSTFN